MYGQKAAYFVLMNYPIPEHIQKTFALTPDGTFKHEQEDRVMVQIGGVIPEKLTGAVIIYSTSMWYSAKAYEVMQQLNEIYPGRLYILGIPVAEE